MTNPLKNVKIYPFGALAQLGAHDTGSVGLAMTAVSVGFMLERTSAVRLLGLVASPMWLTYNIYHFSVGAITCEIISLASIIVGMFRHDRRGKAAAPKEK